MEGKYKWLPSLIEALNNPNEQYDLESFSDDIRKLATTKEVLLEILKKVKWLDLDTEVGSRREELLRLCQFINEVRSKKPKKVLGVDIATDPCIIELLSDWILPPDIPGVETLLLDLDSDSLYEYFSDKALDWCTEEDYDQSDVEKRFTRLHQNLMTYDKAMSPSELRDWADNLPSLERADMLGSDPHPLFVRCHAISLYLSHPSWVEVQEGEQEQEQLPDLEPAMKPEDAMANVNQSLLELARMDTKKYEKALARLRYTYQLIPYGSKKRFVRENDAEVGNTTGDVAPEDEVNDIDYFHRYGPVNTGDSSAPECVRYGGCRMLLCCCQVTGDEGWDDNEDMVYSDKEWEDRDWFKSSCDVCGISIKRKEYALRLPAGRGGWYGCYCSYNCQDSAQCSSIEEEMKLIVKEQLETNKIYVWSGSKSSVASNGEQAAVH